MMTPRTDVIFFVEDPGAANYIVDLPEALRSMGRAAAVLATGPAIAYLKERDVPFHAIDVTEDPLSLLEHWAPRLLAIGTSENPFTMGLSLADAAKKLKLITVGLVDGYANAPFRFRGTGNIPLAHVPDCLIVPDLATANAYSDLGMETRRLRVCGHPHYDRVRRIAKELSTQDRTALRASLFSGCPVGKPVIVFASELSTGLDPEQFRYSAEYTLKGNGHANGRTEIVLHEFLEAIEGLDPRPYLVLRLHPKNRREDLAGFLGAFNQISSGGSPLELLQGADLVVGMTSMLLQEAVLMGRPTLSIVPRESEKSWLPTIAVGATPCATRRIEVKDWLERILKGPRTISPSGDIFGDPDSDATGKTAAFLIELLGNKPS